jgi:hypothetical protein
MNCSYCSNKGYIESSILRDNRSYPTILKCPNPKCNHESKYYNKIKELFSDDSTISAKELLSEIRSKNHNIDYPVDLNNKGQLDPIGPGLVEKPQEPVSLNSESNNNQKDPTRNSESTGPGSSQVTSNADHLKVTYNPDDYPFIPSAIIKHYNNMSEEGRKDFIIALDTPWGPKYCESIPEANRISMVIKEYSDCGEELTIASGFDNVEVFPLGYSLGFGFD